MIINSQGKYTIKETGESQDYDYSYESYATIDEALESLGEAKALALIQRMVKVDANNTAREKAKAVNGHSTRVIMSEEEKAEKKAERAANKNLLAALKANPEALAMLQEA